jgi:hypothetical protein
MLCSYKVFENARMIIRRALIVSVAIVLCAAPLRAQSTAVVVTGTVVDQTGAILQGAQVDVTNAAGVAVAATTSDQNGAFRLGSLAQGRYALRITYEGFEPTTVRVTVGARAPSPLRVTLPLARIAQDVTVGDVNEVKANAASNVDASTVDQSVIDQLPIFNGDILATVSRFLDASAIGTGATLIVNGMEVNSLMAPASAIQQIRINSDPYSAEFFRPGRGRIEVITKPGSQKYQGTANVTFRDGSLDARNAFATVKPSEQRRIFEFFAGGPLGHEGTTSFTASGRHDADDSEGIVVAQDLSGPIQTNVATPSRNVLAAINLTHQKGKSTTMALTLSYQDEKQHSQGVGGLTLPTAGIDWNSIEQDLTYNQQTVFSPRVLNQFRILAGNEYETWTSATPASSIVVLDAFTGGGAQGDRLRTEHHIQATDTLTLSLGRHIVKAGINIPDFSRRRFDDNSNRGGTFYFSSLSDYSAGRPYAFNQQTGDGHVVFLDQQYGVFVQDEIAARPNLTLTAGLRYDWQNYAHDNNNVAPRFSAAFAPTAKRDTVIRGGVGIFYDRTGAGPINDILRYDGQHLIRLVVTDPGYPDPFASAAQVGAVAPSIVRFAPDLIIPYTLQFGAGVERQLRKGTSASIAYTGTRGFHQFRSRDVNAPTPPGYTTRPDPAFGVIRQIESEGRLSSHSVQFSLRGQLSRFVTGSAQYTYSRTMNDTGGINWMPPNSYDLSLEYGRADSDQRHRLDVLATINPGSLLNLGIAFAMYSGRPYSLTTGHDDFNTGTANARPTGVARNTLEGPNYADLDLRWSHDVQLGARSRVLTLGLDAFNVLNRVNYSRFIGAETSPFFGQAIAAQPPRRLQLSARARF